MHALDLLELEAGAIYVMDRGYVDFARLYALHLAGAFFVTRAKSNMTFQRVYSTPTDRKTGIICDQRIALDGFYTQQDYPAHLRRVRFNDPDTGKTLVFLTNQMTLPAATICALYKNRWQVELFFKWIKQHLRIKRSSALGERGQDANLDRGIGLCARRHRQEEAATGRLALHFATDFVGHPFREDALAASLSRCRLHSSRGCPVQPTESIHDLTGQ